jgi:hypothetical protein
MNAPVLPDVRRFVIKGKITSLVNARLLAGDGAQNLIALLVMDDA